MRTHREGSKNLLRRARSPHARLERTYGSRDPLAVGGDGSSIRLTVPADAAESAPAVA